LADFYCQLIASVVEMEIAYVHVAGASAQDRGDLSLSPIGLRLRHVFPGMLIASGAYTPAGAIAAVESRWADAIAFTMMMGDGATLLAAIRSAGSGVRESDRRIRDPG
jgi:2,4-dienoyl-CoA reductase-like NADH-dependent reductase (Old Yellow Enzyme family)